MVKSLVAKYINNMTDEMNAATTDEVTPMEAAPEVVAEATEEGEAPAEEAAAE